MKIKSFFDKQKRGKLFSAVIKDITHVLSPPVETVPVFLFGKQRSGTTMLMYIFHLHPDTKVHEESSNSKAYSDYRIRSLERLEKMIQASKFSHTCFQPLADSHLIKKFIDRFPKGRFIWIYRGYQDVANSHLKRFAHATRAIKIVCNNQTGGGWFKEGVSKGSAKILREIHASYQLGEYDYACLAWWTRNRIFIEKKLKGSPNLIPLRYEDIVTEPDRTLSALFEFVGLRNSKCVYKYVHQRSIKKNAYPSLVPIVRELCEDLQTELNKALPY